MCYINNRICHEGGKRSEMQRPLSLKKDGSRPQEGVGRLTKQTIPAATSLQKQNKRADAKKIFLRDVFS